MASKDLGAVFDFHRAFEIVTTGGIDSARVDSLSVPARPES
jgi:hypothetical protein